MTPQRGTRATFPDPYGAPRLSWIFFVHCPSSQLPLDNPSESGLVEATTQEKSHTTLARVGNPCDAQPLGALGNYKTASDERRGRAKGKLRHHTRYREYTS